jgi:SET domain-containing protein
MVLIPNLGKRKKHPSKQYEVVALEDFETEDFIGEYVGKVLYQKVSALRCDY